jgi:hypothetical protein
MPASAFPAFLCSSLIPPAICAHCALGASGLFQPPARHLPAWLPSKCFRAKAARLAKWSPHANPFRALCRFWAIPSQLREFDFLLIISRFPSYKNLSCVRRDGRRAHRKAAGHPPRGRVESHVAQRQARTIACVSSRKPSSPASSSTRTSSPSTISLSTSTVSPTTR